MCWDDPPKKEESAFKPGLIAFFCDLSRPRPVLVGAMVNIQGIFGRMGMGMMTGWKRGFFLGMVGCMDLLMLSGVMFYLFQVPVLVLTGP